MGSLVLKSKSLFPQMESGMHQAVVCGINPLSDVIKAEDVKPGKFGDVIYLRIEFANAEGKRVSKLHFLPVEKVTGGSTYQAAGFPKKLRADCASIIGGDAGNNFALETLIGKQVQLLVEEVTKDNKTYANIIAITKPAKGQNVPQPTAVATSAPAGELEITDDDIPF